MPIHGLASPACFSIVYVLVRRFTQKIMSMLICGKVHHLHFRKHHGYHGPVRPCPMHVCRKWTVVWKNGTCVSWCRLNKLAGRHNVSKNWDTDSDNSGEDEEEEEEEIAETGSKGSMNQPSRPSSSRVQSDAETEYSTQQRQPRLQSGQDNKAAKRLLGGRKRYAILLVPAPTWLALVLELVQQILHNVLQQGLQLKCCCSHPGVNATLSLSALHDRRLAAVRCL